MTRFLRSAAFPISLAVLLLGIFLAQSTADLIALPKVWVAGETLTAADLNSNFSAVTQQVNGNLKDVNVAATAAIKGSKLAATPNGVGTSQINDLAVTSGKLAAGAVTLGKIGAGAVDTTALGASAVTSAKIQDLGIATGDLAVLATTPGFQTGTPTPSLSITTTETDVVTLPALTTRGGRVLVFGSVGLAVGATNTGCDLTLRLYSNGVVVHAVSFEFTAFGTGGGVIAPLPTPMTLLTSLPGTYTIKMTAQATPTCALSTRAVNTGSLYALEFG